MRHTLVARSWGDVMWDELSVSYFYNTVTIGNGETGTKNDFQEKRCFQFAEVVIISTTKESLHSTERGSLQVPAVYRSRKCRLESTVYNSNKVL